MSYQAATAAELLGVKPKKTETTLTLAYSGGAVVLGRFV